MRIGGVIQHQVHDDADVARMRRFDQVFELVQRPIGFIHAVIVGNVIAIVAQGRRVDRHDPNTIHAEGLQIIELFSQPAQIAASIAIAILESADGNFLKNCILVPEGIIHIKSGLVLPSPLVLFGKFSL